MPLSVLEPFEALSSRAFLEVELLLRFVLRAIRLLVELPALKPELLSELVAIEPLCDPRVVFALVPLVLDILDPDADPFVPFPLLED